MRSAVALASGDAPAPVLPLEQELWLAVIALAVQDARRGCPRAKAWLFSKSDDFHAVCRFADVEPEYVLKLALRPGDDGPDRRSRSALLRQDRLRRALPARPHELMELLPEYTRQYNGRKIQSKMLHRDLRIIGAKKEGSEWRMPR